MKQQQLPIKLKARHLFIKIFLPVLLIMAIVAVVFYFVFIASKDQMLAYFPSDSLLYVSMNVDSDLLNEEVFNKLPFDIELHEEIRGVLKEYINHSGKRNIAFGLLEVGDSIEPLYIISLKNEIDGNHNIFAHLDSYGYKSFKINNNVLNKHLVIISKSQGVIEKVKGVLDNSVKGLTDDIDVSYRLNTLIKSKGVIMLDSSIISKIIPAEVNTVFEGLIPKDQKLVMQIHSYNPVIIIDGEDLPGEDSLIVQNIDKMRFGFKVNEPMVDIDNYINTNVNLENLAKLEKTYNSSYIGDIKELEIDGLEYTNISDKEHILTLHSNNVEAVANSVSKLLIEYLAVKNIGWMDQILPDGTKIKKYAKNRKGLEFEDKNTDGSISGMEDVINDDYYLREIEAEFVTISRNVNTSSYESTVIEGCTVADGYEYVALGSEYVNELPIIGTMFKFVALITYPHSYPQNILCLW